MKLKLNALKAAFPLCQPIWALLLTLSIFPPYCCLLALSLPLSLLLISQRERFIKSPKLRLISTVLWIVKMPRLTWRLQSHPPTHPPSSQPAHQHCHGNKVARNSFSPDWGWGYHFLTLACSMLFYKCTLQRAVPGAEESELTWELSYILGVIYHQRQIMQHWNMSKYGSVLYSLALKI